MLMVLVQPGASATSSDVTDDMESHLVNENYAAPGDCDRDQKSWSQNRGLIWAALKESVDVKTREKIWFKDLCDSLASYFNDNRFPEDSYNSIQQPFQNLFIALSRGEEDAKVKRLVNALNVYTAPKDLLDLLKKAKETMSKSSRSAIERNETVRKFVSSCVTSLEDVEVEPKWVASDAIKRILFQLGLQASDAGISKMESRIVSALSAVGTSTKFSDYHDRVTGILGDKKYRHDFDLLIAELNFQMNQHDKRTMVQSYHRLLPLCSTGKDLRLEDMMDYLAACSPDDKPLDLKSVDSFEIWRDFSRSPSVSKLAALRSHELLEPPTISSLPKKLQDSVAKYLHKEAASKR